jgi:hypothetical protein
VVRAWRAGRVKRNPPVLVEGVAMGFVPLNPSYRPRRPAAPVLDCQN